MSKPKAILSRQGATSLRIEYVKCRRTLRLTGWRERGPALDPVEVDLPAMVELLDIDPGDVGADAWYLLFGGREGELRGGADDLVGVYRTPTDGRARFLELQQARAAGGGGWAELVMLHPTGQLKRVSWFGERPGEGRFELDGARAASDPPSGLPARRTRRRLFGGWDPSSRRDA